MDGVQFFPHKTSAGAKATSANLEIGGNQVFHTGNDGSGSGLDADTVDGIQGASFLRSDAADTLDAVLSVGQNGRIDFPDYSSVTDNPNTQVDYIRFGVQRIHYTVN